MTTTPLRAVVADERRCPATRTRWPLVQCELTAGHDGQHSAADLTYRDYRPVTWRTGRER